MAIRTNCPHCDQAYTLVDEQAGKKIRCKACTTVFVAPPPEDEREGAPRRGARRDDYDDYDDYDRPRRRSRSRQGGVPVWVWLAGGGLLLLLVVGVVVALLATGTFNNKVTQENFLRLQMGMREAEVRSILGSPSQASDLGRNPSGSVRMLVWKRGNNIVSVTFTDDRATNIHGTFTN
jgi:predicted Zn finger-like uncharacterized protein